MFIAPNEIGIELYTEDGLAPDPDITPQLYVWDLGTEVNEPFGEGENQATRQSAPNTGVDENGVVNAYHDIQVWPQWSACELGGAIRRDLQSSGKGGMDATVAFNWLFEVIGVDLICETAALDNVRTARLLGRIGFTYKGEIKSKTPGGGFRPSKYWELGIADWQSHSESAVP